MIMIDFSNLVGSCQIFMCVVRVLPTFDLNVRYRLLWLEGANKLLWETPSRVDLLIHRGPRSLLRLVMIFIDCNNVINLRTK